MKTAFICAVGLTFISFQPALAGGGGGGGGHGGGGSHGANYQPSGGWTRGTPSSNVRDHRNGGGQGGVTVTTGTPQTYHHGGPNASGGGPNQRNPRNPRDHRY
jgi:hypothetical protein